MKKSVFAKCFELVAAAVSGYIDGYSGKRILFTENVNDEISFYALTPYYGVFVRRDYNAYINTKNEAFEPSTIGNSMLSGYIESMESELKYSGMEKKVEKKTLLILETKTGENVYLSKDFVKQFGKPESLAFYGKSAKTAVYICDRSCGQYPLPLIGVIMPVNPDKCK